MGTPATFGNLTMLPLTNAVHAPREYLLLDEALEQGLVTVREISESGSVPDLAFENSAGHPVLLIDGEELVGAKQNRVLNLSVLRRAGVRDGPVRSSGDPGEADREAGR